MTTPTHLAPAAAQSLAKWHDIVVKRDFGSLGSLLDSEAVFLSPIVFKPYPGAMLAPILTALTSLVSGFTYHRQFASSDGLAAVLEFSGTIGGKRIEGMDLIQFNAQGKIVEFKVMVRPFSSAQLLREEMAKLLAANTGGAAPGTAAG